MKRGTRVGQGYVALTVDGDGINEGIVDSVEGAGDDIDRAGDEHGESYGDHFSDGFFARLKKKFSGKISKELDDRMGDAGDEAGLTFGQRMIESLSNRLALENNRIAALTEQIWNDNGRSDKRMGRLTTALAASEGVATRLNKELTETLRLEQRIATAAGKVSGNLGKNDRLGDRFGGLFGAGSRNNALNLFGKTVAGVLNMTEGLFKGLAKFPSLLSKFSEGFKSAADGASLLQKIGAGFGESGIGMGKALSSIAASGPGAAAALVAITAAMVLMVSVANALLAILVALASTIASALVGALLVGAGAFAALAAAGGLATLAFMSMTDAQQDLLKNSFEPLHQVAIGLGQVILTDLVPAFDTWSRNLQIALAYAEPLARVLGGALARAGSVFTASLSGAGFQQFLASLAQIRGGASAIEGIIVHMSSALGQFLNGLSSTFAAIIPYVLQFSVYLDKVATRFANWASSAKGQNAISDFVSRALNSLASLWNFITALGGLLSKILFDPSSQSTGNNIFDRMAAAVRRFTAYISKDNRLEKWLKEGLTFAIALGDSIKTIGKLLQRLNQSGVIDFLAALANGFASIYEAADKIPGLLEGLVAPIIGIADAIGWLTGKVGDLLGITNTAAQSAGNLVGPLETIANLGQELSSQPAFNFNFDASGLDSILGTLQSSGATALANTSTDSGGYAEPVDPDALSAAQMAQYDAIANAIIKKAPTYAQIIRQALRAANSQIAKVLKQTNQEFADALRAAATATDAGSVTSALQSVVESQTAAIRATMQAIKGNAKSMVDEAKAAVQAAAQALADATTKSGAAEAMAALNLAQSQLSQAESMSRKAQRRANRLRRAMDKANAILDAQGVLTQSNADALAQGFKVVNATLADYADARAQVAAKLEIANQKLQEAISLRDNFRAAVTDAVNSFAALTTAQAKTINGVEQALTSNDINTNLQSRLDQIKKFQTNLHILLSQGLSQAAYKQLLDAGVEQGGAYAQALVNGGNQAVQQTNSLVAQVQQVADQLGLEASNRLYQAGVDAAQGLVDGLLSLSQQLDSAATALGNAIAQAVKEALGIASPSKLMFDYMDYGVGDGLVKGLEAQHGKVARAAERLSGNISVSSEVAAYASRTGGSGYTGSGGVSGNDAKWVWTGDIITPTEDPHAVAVEVLNEVTGRLP